MTQSQEGKPQTVTITEAGGGTRTLRVWKLPSGLELAVSVDYQMIYTHYVQIMTANRRGEYIVRGPKFVHLESMPLPAIDEYGMFKLGTQTARLIKVFDQCDTLVRLYKPADAEQLLEPGGYVSPFMLGVSKWTNHTPTAYRGTLYPVEHNHAEPIAHEHKKRPDVFDRLEGRRQAFGDLFERDSLTDRLYDSAGREVALNKERYCQSWVTRDPVTGDIKLTPYVPSNARGLPERPDYAKSDKSRRKLSNEDRRFLYSTFCVPQITTPAAPAAACAAKLPDPATSAPQSVERAPAGTVTAGV